MKKHIFITLSIAFLLVVPYSCEAPLDTAYLQICNVDDPLEELDWLKDIKRSIQLSMQPAGSEIIQYIYEGEPVFWVDLCYMCPDNLIVVYDCEGKVVCEFGGIDGRITCDDFSFVATDSTMLFRSIQN